MRRARCAHTDTAPAEIWTIEIERELAERCRTTADPLLTRTPAREKLNGNGVDSGWADCSLLVEEQVMVLAQQVGKLAPMGKVNIIATMPPEGLDEEKPAGSKRALEGTENVYWEKMNAYDG